MGIGSGNVNAMVQAQQSVVRGAIEFIERTLDLIRKIDGLVQYGFCVRGRPLIRECLAESPNGPCTCRLFRGLKKKRFTQGEKR